MPLIATYSFAKYFSADGKLSFLARRRQYPDELLQYRILLYKEYKLLRQLIPISSGVLWLTVLSAIVAELKTIHSTTARTRVEFSDLSLTHRHMLWTWNVVAYEISAVEHRAKT